MVGTSDMPVARSCSISRSTCGRVEPADHHLADAHQGAGLGTSPAVGVKQRDGVQLNAVVVFAEYVGDIQGVEIERAVREHHAFGRARGAGGIEELSDGVLVDGKRVGTLDAAARPADLRKAGRFPRRARRPGRRGAVAPPSAAKSLSKMSTRGSAWRRIPASSAAVRRTLSGMTMAPASRTPK